MNCRQGSNALKFTVATIILIFFCYQAQAQKQSRPNIIFILGDDVGYDLLSVNGSKSYHTPHLDSMAHNGINFTHCEGTPLCSPSRKMLLTGKHNFRDYSNWGYMDDSEKTFGNLFQDAGYKTAFFGKYQLPTPLISLPDWGFDTYSIFSISEDTVALLRYKDPTLVDNNGRVPDSATQNKYCDDILTDRISDFVDKSAGNPFFIYYPMSLSHDPFSPTPEDGSYVEWNPYLQKSDTVYFHSMMEYLDMEVGKVLNMLKTKGLDKNTIVLFAGDNGTPTQIYYDVNNETNVEGQKGASLEGGTHVPLIAYWPDHIKPGSVNDDLIDFSDFFTTFAQAINVTDLSKYGPKDGLSFYNRMLGTEDTAKQQLFLHFDPYPGFSPLKRWIRNKTYKLYDSSVTHKGEFYNVVKDELENSPLEDDQLTDEEKAIKANFQHILDSIPEWMVSPEINNPFYSDVTATSVNVGATIVNSGQTPLIDRGSTILHTNSSYPDIEQSRRHDVTVALGTFTENRYNLNPETQYAFTLYAMNSNASHSTGYAVDTFFTLSTPPVAQPSSFKAITDSSCAINLSWTQAQFPSAGATKKGYALFSSTGSLQFIANPNGHAPSAIIQNGSVAYSQSVLISQSLNAAAKISGLAGNASYNFLLVPFTYNGSSDSTYNYLFKNALSVNSFQNACLTPLSIAPNPSNSSFTVSVDNNQVNSGVFIRVFDEMGRLVYNYRGTHISGLTFGGNFTKGVYFVKVQAGSNMYTQKILKN